MAEVKLNEMLLEAYASAVKGFPLWQCYEWLQLIPKTEKFKNIPEFMVAVKRRLRKLNKNFTDGLEENRAIKVYEDGSVIERVVLKADTMEQAENEFENEHYIEYWDRGYDCTGQAFTEWHKIFKVRDKFVLYHSIGMDC